MKYEYRGKVTRVNYGSHEDQIGVIVTLDLDRLVQVLLDQCQREHTNLFSGYEGTLTVRVVVPQHIVRKEEPCLESGKIESTQSRNLPVRRKVR